MNIPIDLDRLSAENVALRQELKDTLPAYASQLKEITELKNLIRIIFASTLPYNDGEPAFSDEVVKEWKRLAPSEFDSIDQARSV